MRQIERTRNVYLSTKKLIEYNNYQHLCL